MGAPGVEEYCVAYGPLLAVEQAAHHLGVVGGVASAQGVGRRGGDPQGGRVDRRLGDLAVVDGPHRRGRGGGELVEPVVAAEDPGVHAPGREDSRHHRGHPAVGAADRLRGRPHRVRQRPEEVEDRADAELAPRDRGVPHRGVERRREAEGDAGLLGQRGDPVGREVQPDAEGLEDVGAAGQRGRRAVAVLDHLGTGPRGHDRGHGRDVHRHRAVHPGADHVEQPAGDRDRGAGRPERLGHPGDLVDGLSLGPQPHRESGDLGRRRLAGEDLPHSPAGLGRRQVLPGHQGREDLGPGGGHGTGPRTVTPGRGSGAARSRTRPAAPGRGGAGRRPRPATRSRATRPAGVR